MNVSYEIDWHIIKLIHELYAPA